MTEFTSQLKVSSLITKENITVNFSGQTHMIPRSDPSAQKIIDCLKTKNYDEIPELISVAKRIEKMSDGHFTVKDGEVFVNGKVVGSILGKKMLEFESEGLPYEPLVKFAENLQLNPSFRAAQQLYSFLEKNSHPITDEGCFIAYKRVNENFTDIRTSTFDNSPGNVVSMPRNEVDEDPTMTCSTGLHVSNWEYASKHYYSGTGVMVEVAVNPKDVVAIPIDYNESKMRVCEYTVIGVVENPNEKHLVNTAKISSADDKASVNDVRPDDTLEDCSVCDACGIESDDGDSYCSHCGEELYTCCC